MQGKNKPKVTMINVIREPMDRARSNFDYVINPQARSPNLARQVEAARKADPRCGCHGMDFNDCVELSDSRNCTTSGADDILVFMLNTRESKEYKTMPLSIRCAPETQRAVLNKAKRHVDTHYLFIGITEQLPLTIRYLEKVLPSFFKGATQALSMVAKQNVDSGDHRSADLTERTKAIMRTNPCNYAVIEIYKYIEQLFWKKVKEAGLV
eukprot:4301313-Pyramimonas_sp.AAC.1